ncbi:hypothetical protein PVAG01_01241 [Phlyctema vagabunda]|uniref:Hydrophobin n=1 Tax=Phlyctema vagabunda TaxID=108571 RepID=A0ABR4PX57_9HELO
MQFPTILSIVALAGIAQAVPTGTPSGGCTAGQTQFCCNEVGSGALLSLSCLLTLLGNTCNSQTICCSPGATCTNADGTAITVPITIPIVIDL